MSFFAFRQNNSGGFYIGPEYVIVRADNADEANEKAEENSEVYFDGARSGQDCRCCGSRWSRATEYDGTEEPKVYDQVIAIPNLNEEISSTFEYPTQFPVDEPKTLKFHYVP